MPGKNGKRGKMNQTKKRICFFILYAAIHFFLNFQTTVGTYVTTMYAFSYRYGFISRGFQGTVLLILDQILPFSILSYEGVLALSYIQIFLVDALLILFLYFCLKMTENVLHHGIITCAFIFITFVFPEYVAFQNFGRSDAWMVIICILGMLSLMKGKLQWGIVCLCIVGVCIHQGFVLMFMSPMLVILLVKAIDTMEGNNIGNLFSGKSAKYTWILLSSILAVSALFVYFTFLSHGNSREIYHQIYAQAENMGYAGYDQKVHEQLIMNEILGEDPSSQELQVHIYNFKEGIVFGLLVSPYIILLITFFKGCIKDASGIWQKLKYVGISVGAATILPDLIAKIDYGRWMFAIIFYYAMTVLTLLAMGDRIIVQNFHCMAVKLKRHRMIMTLLILYPLLMVPMGDTWITPVSREITDFFVNMGW